MNFKEYVWRSKSQLVRMMNWFLLTKAGYQNRVGYDQDGVYNLLTVVTTFLIQNITH